ncbi:MAG: protein-export chaperone SecB [Alphaproteobacteria bacterium]|nr:protein-export chaperone SecB [Alphaproteobacteria bacterium]
MSDATKTIEAPGLPVVLHAQYVKDLSFENPNATDMLRPGLQPPEMDMNIDIESKQIEERETAFVHEVLLKITVTAKRGEKTVFIAEVIYGSILSLQKDVPSARAHAILFVDIPQILFPFARHAIAMATQSGGYPPLLLNPVDFRGLYLARFAPANDGVASNA